MITSSSTKVYPSAKVLVNENVASRIHASDSSLYAFDDDSFECAGNFMGWTDLASNPPYDIHEIEKFAREARKDGFDQVLLIGEGGSTQAPMTITKYNSVDSNDVRFRVLDSVSPTRVRSILGSMDLSHTLVLVSSKSGGTIETLSVLEAVLLEMKTIVEADEIPNHLVAITDPKSPLAERAVREGWRAVFEGKASVGGRFSALSVFGLVPAALVGLDLTQFMEMAAKAEKACAEDSIDNPAICLAAFLYDNAMTAGRDKVCFLSPKRGRVFGLWIEQLVAESLGKHGHGILPNIEPDPLDLLEDRKDRTLVVCRTANDNWDEVKSFELGLSVMAPTIPVLDFSVGSVYELAWDFLVWEYAVAMCGYLMGICPFDQPDVASAKAKVIEILGGEEVPVLLIDRNLCGIEVGNVEVRASQVVTNGKASDISNVLCDLIETVKPGDYFAINAFVPFDGEGRREALDEIRHLIASKLGNVACLEIGPRYLHSTGQLQKGGPDNGVFLILSTDEMKDIPLPDGAKASSLGTLAKSQAIGDFAILSERGRRVVHINLPDNSATTMRLFAETFSHAMRSKLSPRRK